MATGLRTAVLFGLGLWLLTRASSAKGSSMGLTGEKVEAKRSWDGATDDWARTRFGAALSAVKSHWSGAVDDEKARQIALSLVTHWSIETGAGAQEWNYNVGNIVAVGSQKYAMLRDVSGNTMPFRAFDYLQEGVEAYIALLASKYKAAASLLANDPEDPGWYIALGKAGWFDPTKAKPASTWEQAAAGFAARRANLAQYAAKQ